MDTLPQAHVTLDVLHTGVMWGGYLTMNFWAKSVATGVFLLGAFFFRGPKGAFFRLLVPVVGFIFISVTLLVTLADLHQPLRFWHMFVYPHTTSMLNLGAWVLSVYAGLTVLLAFLAFREHTGWFDRLVVPTWVVAFLATIYTGALLGQASARELWHTPTEMAQMLAAAGLAGSAVLLLVPGPTEAQRTTMAWVLGLSALVSLTLFLSELVFAPQKSEEAEYLIHLLVEGELSTLFFAGLTLGFIIPLGLVMDGLRRRSSALFSLASGSALLGLWLVKHSWLIAPQLIPMS